MTVKIGTHAAWDHVLSPGSAARPWSPGISEQRYPASCVTRCRSSDQRGGGAVSGAHGM